MYLSKHEDRLKRARWLKDKIENNSKLTEQLIKITDLSDEQLGELVNVYPSWETGIYLAVGDIIKYENKLYEVIQAHSTLDNWKPSSVPALYKEISPKETNSGQEVIPQWKQPTGGHDAYNKGDKVLFNGKVYESLNNGNAHSPSAYPAGWKEIK